MEDSCEDEGSEGKQSRRLRSFGTKAERFLLPPAPVDREAAAGLRMRLAFAFASSSSEDEGSASPSSLLSSMRPFFDLAAAAAAAGLDLDLAAEADADAGRFVSHMLQALAPRSFSRVQRMQDQVEGGEGVAVAAALVEDAGRCTGAARGCGASVSSLSDFTAGDACSPACRPSLSSSSSSSTWTQTFLLAVPRVLLGVGARRAAAF